MLDFGLPRFRGFNGRMIAIMGLKSLLRSIVPVIADQASSAHLAHPIPLVMTVAILTCQFSRSSKRLWNLDVRTPTKMPSRRSKPKAGITRFGKRYSGP